jgi:hypothetical protein
MLTSSFEHWLVNGTYELQPDDRGGCLRLVWPLGAIAAPISAGPANGCIGMTNMAIACPLLKNSLIGNVNAPNVPNKPFANYKNGSGNRGWMLINLS